MAAFLNGCKFLAVSNGLGDFAVGSAVAGAMTPAQAGAVNGVAYKYRAESIDKTQWEFGEGVYVSGTVTLPRTTVLFSSTGGAKVSFTAAPQVSIVALAEDLTLGNLAALSSTSYKLINLTRVMSLASGNQSITGVGFRPRLIQFQTGLTSGWSTWNSFGFADAVGGNNVEWGSGTGSFFQGGIAGIVRDDVAGANYNTFTLASFDADGFTLAWTKTGAPTSTAMLLANCFR